MITKLSPIQDWLPLARQGNWSVLKLAKLCNVSQRTLQRYFLQTLGKPPKTWLAEQRQKQAMELLRDGSSIKEVAARLGYRYAHHFSRGFKRYWGYSPTEKKALNRTAT